MFKLLTKTIMETNNRTLAKTIDLINEFVIKYYIGEKEEEPFLSNIEIELYERHKINRVSCESAYRIMKEEGYIEYVMNDEKDTVIRKLKRTPKGLLLYLNGGILKQQNRENAKTKLFKIGQISLIFAGIYYFLEIIKILISFFVY